jgi:hypothetical protein
MILVTAALLADFAVQATAAEFYVIQDSSTKRCTVVDKKPTVRTETIVGENGGVHTTSEGPRWPWARRRSAPRPTNRA